MISTWRYALRGFPHRSFTSTIWCRQDFPRSASCARLYPAALSNSRCKNCLHLDKDAVKHISFPSQAHPDVAKSESKHLFFCFVYGRKGPVEEEPWLYGSGRIGDFELFAFDRASVAFTRSRPRLLSSDVNLACPALKILILRIVLNWSVSIRRRRQTIDPLTGRVTELYANAAYCRLAGGTTVSAHIAQVAARALPEHVTHADHLCRLDPFSPALFGHWVLCQAMPFKRFSIGARDNERLNTPS
jgi:hypothetical protein